MDRENLRPVAPQGLLLACLLILAPACVSVAVDYTWDGTSNNWNSAHWLPGLVAGPVAAGNTATIDSGTVTFSVNDSFGIHSTASTPVVNLNSGGTLASGGRFTTIIGLNLNGGTLLANGGVNNPYGAFALKGTVTVAGSSASAISLGAGGFNTISIGTAVAGGSTTFDVADVTASSAADLTVAVPLNNIANVQSGIVKTGAGTMTLTAANVYTGTTSISGGTLDVAAGGSLSGAGNVTTTGGGVLAISGAVTLAGGRVFATGNGISGTTGTVIVNSGGTLSIGNGGSATLIGGSTSANSQYGAGTLTINGGTVTVAAAGLAGATNDATTLWLNPYGNSGVSTLNLDGGLLSTARSIATGSGTAALAVVNLNGGTLQAGVSSVGFLSGPTVNVRNGGARIDTQAFNITITPGLLHSGIGGDAAIDGGLVKTGGGTLTLGAAGTFTGDVDINAGKLTNPVAANSVTPTSSGLGNLMTPGRQIRVNTGATLEFTNNDSLGAATVLQNTSLVVDGGTVDRTSKFVTLPNVTLRNGATLTGANGVNANFQSYNLLGTVTVSGASGSTIATTGASFTGIHLGGNITFDVGATSPLTISAPLINKVNGTGSGLLTKTGSGVLTLAGNNSYTGTTAVQQGTLLVNGVHTGGGLITVSSGATLGGGGQVGDVEIEGGGILSPGNSAGHLTVGSLTLNPSATLDFELGAPSPVQNPGSDFVTVGNSLTLNGTLNITALPAFGTPGAGSSWLLMTSASGIADNGIVLGSTPALSGGLTFALDISSGENVFLNVVPEAGTAGLVFLGLMLLRRRPCAALAPRSPNDENPTEEPS